MAAVDIHQTADHPIVLGESLRDEGVSASSHLGIKYNWMPKNGFGQTSATLRGSWDDLKLTLENDDEAFHYKGWASDIPEEHPQLALIYDPQKSVYTLEKLSTLLNMNIKSASNISADQIRRYAPLAKSNKGETHGHHIAHDDLFDEDDDDVPDTSNPFDYRNFLDEARQSIDKPSHTGGRTPLPGGGTPRSGLSSPAPAPGPSFGSSPQFAPIEIVSSSQKLEDHRRRRQAATTSKSKTTKKSRPLTKPRAAAPSKQAAPLSAERVIDSDSDGAASAGASDRPSPVSPPSTLPTKSRHRTVSSVSARSAPRSPRRVVHGGDLEIDAGSPPPQTRRKRDYMVDREAFRSQTGTPSLSRNPSRPGTRDREVGREPHQDIEMPDAGPDADEQDETMKYFQDDDDDDGDDEPVKDADVDVLVLDDGGAAASPSPPPMPVHAPQPRRRQSSTLKRRRPRSPSPPHAPTQHSISLDDDDDGALAAELEAALEEQQASKAFDRDETSVGLGIGGAGTQEDESDVSEEE